MSTKRIIDYSQLLENEKDVVQRLLHEWQPDAWDKSEKHYEQELCRWLIQKLQDVPIVAQYGIAKGKADIVVEDRHVIELKLGFSDVCDLDRCIGQLERYRMNWVDPSRGPVYLVIVGGSDPGLRDVLYRWFSQTSGHFFGTWFYICEKRPGVEDGKSFWHPSTEL
jgi:hypothetical protein